jgi:hypothetical protein
MGEKSKPILCLDFDGVCHSYTSGWKGATVIPDDAVPGLFEFLEQVAPHFDIQVYSTRSETPEGRDAMALWFADQRRKWRANGGQGSEIISISFPANKPSAFIGLDDRVLTFNGVWPRVEFLQNFQPWYKSAPVAGVHDLLKQHEDDTRRFAELIIERHDMARTINHLANIILDHENTSENDRFEAEEAIEKVLPLL